MERINEIALRVYKAILVIGFAIVVVFLLSASIYIMTVIAFPPPSQSLTILVKAILVITTGWLGVVLVGLVILALLDRVTVVRKQ